MLPEGAEGQGEAPLPSPETYLKGQSREVRSWGSPPPMHCEGPSFTHALLMDGGTQIQGQRPQPPCSLCILESFLKTTWNQNWGIQSQFSGSDVPPGLPVQLQPAKICPQPCQKPPAKNLEPGERDMAALDSPHSGGPTRNNNRGWCPRPRSGQIPHQDPRWPRTSCKGNQNSNRARSNLGPGVDLGPRLRHW